MSKVTMTSVGGHVIMDILLCLWFQASTHLWSPDYTWIHVNTNHIHIYSHRTNLFIFVLTCWISNSLFCLDHISFSWTDSNWVYLTTTLLWQWGRTQTQTVGRCKYCNGWNGKLWNITAAFETPSAWTLGVRRDWSRYRRPLDLVYNSGQSGLRSE